MKKIKFIIYNQYGCLLSIAQRLEKEGYECYSYFSHHAHGYAGKDTGKGLVNIIDDFYDAINDFRDQKDNVVIIIDDNSRGDEMDNLRNEGWHVVGSSSLTDQYENERSKGDEVAEKLGLSVPPSYIFTDFAAAENFLQKELVKNPEKALYFKGDGEDMAGSTYTYPANNIESMIRYLTWVRGKQESGHCKVDKFMFQEVISGIEVDFASWFNGDKFAPFVALDFEQKRIHGLGQAEGCYGNIVTFLNPKEQPYFRDYISKMALEIKGNVAVEWAFNNIVEEASHDPYFLEFTPRHGWDSTQGELALLQDAGKSIGEFYIRMAFKIPFPKDFFPYNRYSCTVRLYSGGIGLETKEVSGRPIFWEPEYEDKLWWYSIKKNDKGEHEITGNPVGCAVFCGDTPEEAMKKCYDFLDPKKDDLMLQDIFYSETIGENVSDNIKRLTQWGLINQ